MLQTAQEECDALLIRQDRNFRVRMQLSVVIVTSNCMMQYFGHDSLVELALERRSRVLDHVCCVS